MGHNELVAVPPETKKFLLSDVALKAIQEVAQESVKPLHLARVAMAGMAKNGELAKCKPESILMGLMEGASMGLEVNGPKQESYLVPYAKSAQFQISWRGFIKLAIETGRVAVLYAEHVYANDEFQVALGTDKRIIHIPYLGEDRGPHTHTYAVVKYTDGSFDFEVMTKRELDVIKSRAKSQTGPWLTDEMEMHKKTPIKRLCKRIPQTEALAKALEYDNLQERGPLVPPNEIKGVRTASLASRVAASIPKTEEEEIEFVDKSTGEVMKSQPTNDEPNTIPPEPEPILEEIPEEPEEQVSVLSPAAAGKIVKAWAKFEVDLSTLEEVGGPSEQWTKETQEKFREAWLLADKKTLDPWPALQKAFGLQSEMF